MSCNARGAAIPARGTASAAAPASSNSRRVSVPEPAERTAESLPYGRPSPPTPPPGEGEFYPSPGGRGCPRQSRGGVGVQRLVAASTSASLRRHRVEAAHAAAARDRRANRGVEVLDHALDAQ